MVKLSLFLLVSTATLGQAQWIVPSASRQSVAQRPEVVTSRQGVVGPNIPKTVKHKSHHKVHHVHKKDHKKSKSHHAQTKSHHDATRGKTYHKSSGSSSQTDSVNKPATKHSSTSKHTNSHHASNAIVSPLHGSVPASDNGHVANDAYLPVQGIATATYYGGGNSTYNACVYHPVRSTDTGSGSSSGLASGADKALNGLKHMNVNKRSGIAKNILTSMPAAAINQLAFQQYSDGRNGGVACGLCFHITTVGTPTPSSSVQKGKSLIIRITDECPADSLDKEWCAQSVSQPTNQHGAKVHFDLNLPTLPKGWFPEAVGTLFVKYRQVQC